MSCGQIALEKCGIDVDTYYSSEIDKDCMLLTNKNYPNTIQIGDCRNIVSEDYKDIDILIGGTPCTNFSSIGTGTGMVTSDNVVITTFEKYMGYKKLGYVFSGQSYLFWEFVRILKEMKPKYFLLENVKMSKEWQDVISKALGVEPIVIDSQLVSAQKRIRLYWTNIPNVCQPENKNITLNDVIDSTIDVCNVSKNIKRYVPQTMPDFVDPYNQKELRDKSTTLRTNVHTGNMWIKTKSGYRHLTRTECEKLQTVPVGYTNGVSECKAKKMLGNGWTVEVITHILSHINKEIYNPLTSLLEF
jgi:DNA (cytosine-5)-methyltransferase 3A